MAKVTTMQFAEVASQIRTWPAKDRQKLVDLIGTWSEDKPRTARKPKPTGAAPTETDEVVKKMRLKRGDGTVAGETPKA